MVWAVQPARHFENWLAVAWAENSCFKILCRERKRAGMGGRETFLLTLLDSLIFTYVCWIFAEKWSAGPSSYLDTGDSWLNSLPCMHLYSTLAKLASVLQHPLHKMGKLAWNACASTNTVVMRVLFPSEPWDASKSLFPAEVCLLLTNQPHNFLCWPNLLDEGKHGYCDIPHHSRAHRTAFIQPVHPASIINC